MKIAVFADVHANLEALQTFIEKSASQGVDRYVFLGDCVGYGPNPNECVKRIRQLPGIAMVLGNHDSTAILKTSVYSMNTYAREAMFWTMERLTPETIACLSSLRLRCVEEDICYAHSSPESPESWQYLNSTPEAFRAFSTTRHHISFVGHTHWPRLFSRRKQARIVPEKIRAGKSYVLGGEARYIVNCGSIGQPRDGTCAGSYCLFDDAARTLVFQRFEYDVERTVAKIREARLPEFLAVRLQKGR